MNMMAGGHAMSVEIRQIVGRAELEQCYDVWDHSFDVGRPFFQMRLDHDRSYGPETTWGAWVDGELAAAIQIFPYRAHYGKAVLRIAGIGNVATQPKFRHRGLAQMILRQQIAWMRDMGFDLSLLFTGIPSFYQQLGWALFPSAPVYTIDPQSLKVGHEGHYQIRKTRPDGDTLPELMAVYHAMANGIPLARVRDRTYWEDWMTWSVEQDPVVWIARRANVVVGYLLATKTSAAPRTYAIAECMYKPDEEAAALALLQRFSLEQQETSPISLRLPLHHAFTRTAQVEERGAGTMWRGFNASRLLEHVAPELGRRWAAMESEHRVMTLAVSMGDALAFRLRLGADGVTVLPPTAAKVTFDDVCQLSWTDLLSLLLLGQVPESLSDKYEHVLGELFPKSFPFVWPIDHF